MTKINGTKGLCMYLQGGVVTTPPTTVNVIAGTGPSGAVATTSGRFTTAASGSGTAVVTRLLPATNYTVRSTQKPKRHANPALHSAQTPQGVRSLPWISACVDALLISLYLSLLGCEDFLFLSPIACVASVSCLGCTPRQLLSTSLNFLPSLHCIVKIT